MHFEVETFPSLSHVVLPLVHWQEVYNTAKVSYNDSNQQYLGVRMRITFAGRKRVYEDSTVACRLGL